MAREFLDVARARGEQAHSGDRRHHHKVAATNAVQAGIAATDAICCVLLGYHARGQDHREALAVLRETRPGTGSQEEKARRSAEWGKQLSTLLAIKSPAEYGVAPLGVEQCRRSIRAAARLVEAATEVVEQGGGRATAQYS